jgi:hypothetical protein
VHHGGQPGILLRADHGRRDLLGHGQWPDHVCHQDAGRDGNLCDQQCHGCPRNRTGFRLLILLPGSPHPGHAADDNTSGIVLTFDGPTATWIGCHTFSSDNVFKCVDNVNSHVTDQVSVVYKLRCNAGRNPIAWELTISWYAAVFTDFLGNKFSGLYKSNLGASCALTPQAPAGDTCSFPNRLDNIFTWDATSTCTPLNLVFKVPATVGSGFPTPTRNVFITL